MAILSWRTSIVIVHTNNKFVMNLPYRYFIVWIALNSLFLDEFSPSLHCIKCTNALMHTYCVVTNVHILLPHYRVT